MPLLPPAAGRTFARQSLAFLANFARPLIANDTKASRTGPLIAYETLGAPVWWGRDYAAFAREGYMSNAVVHRCVRMVAEAAASVPLLLYNHRNELESHPFLDLIAQPAPHTTRADFLAAVYGYLLVSGNAYLEAVTVDGVPRELHALRPDRMRIIPGPAGWPSAFEYTASGGTVRFDAEVRSDHNLGHTHGYISPILHLKLFHPLDDHYGHSPIEAAATAIDIHNQAARWNKALLDNAARPSGALIYGAREGRLSPEQFERLKSELQDGFQGAKNAGRPLLLEGGLDWKPLSLSPREMDFIEAKHAAAREIALALGVPPMLLGIPGDNTYSNYQEATRAFWRQTVLPLVERTAAALSGWLGSAYPTGDLMAPPDPSASRRTPSPIDATGRLCLVPDLDQVPALAPEREALWRQLEAASFLTTDEKRAAIGYPPMPGDQATTPDAELNAPRAPRPFDPRPFEAAPPSRLTPFAKYSPSQPRDERGRWSGGSGDDGEVEAEIDGETDLFDPSLSVGRPEFSDQDNDDGEVILAQARRGGISNATPTQQARLALAEQAQREAVARARELNPGWNPTPQITARDSVEGLISARESIAREARQYYRDLVRDAIPWANPSWGARRLENELRERGFEFVNRTDDPGKMFQHPMTREKVRIMERPTGEPWRTDPPQKRFNNYYYRWQREHKPWGDHIPIPNKD